MLMGVGAVREGSCSFPNLSKILLKKEESLEVEEEKGNRSAKEQGDTLLTRK